MSLIKESVSKVDIGIDDRLRIFRTKFSGSAALPGFDVDAYAIITDRYVVICDTMICPEDMEKLLHEVRDALPGRQLLVVNSHADWDHCWGNCYFVGERSAPIIAHQHSYTRLLSPEARQELTEMQQQYARCEHVVLVPPTITFADTFTVHGGDLTVEFFSAPGHQPDHIAAWLPELGVLLAFDAVETPVFWLNSAEAVPSMRATLQRLYAWQPQYMLCSHGETTSYTTAGDNLAYLDEIERRCRAFLATRWPTVDELGYAADLIHYPVTDVIADKVIDPASCNEIHNRNIGYVMQWLLGSRFPR